jgi:hypothetical protein
MARLNVLIPAYKKEFLPKTLISALRQTYPDLAIIVSDDSPGDEATRQLRTLSYPRAVRFAVGPKRGGMANVEFLLSNLDADCEFVHVLFDDDLVFPTFLQSHVEALVKNTAAMCSVSSRWLVNDHDEIYGHYPLPQAITDHPARAVLLAADFVFKTTVPTATNWLGEFSNAVWRRPFAEHLHERESGEVNYSCLEDIGQMLRASLSAPIVYLNEYLGAFRIHDGQNTGNTRSRTLKAGYLAWGGLAQMGYREGLISIEEADRCLQIIGQRVAAIYWHDQEMIRSIGYCRGDTAEARLHLFDLSWREFLSRPLDGPAEDDALFRNTLERVG